MIQPYGDQAARIIVGVTFDQGLNHLKAIVVSLARSSRATVQLVHVIEPVSGHTLALAPADVQAEFLAALRDEAHRIAKHRLDALAKTFGDDIVIETTTMNGDVARALAEEAEARGASLIVIGTGASPAGATRTDLATAVAIILEANVPVMCVGPQAEALPVGRGSVVVVADDFSQVGLPALEFGTALLERQECGALHHVHVVNPAELIAKPAKNKASASFQEELEYVNRMTEEVLIGRAGEIPHRLAIATSRYAIEVVMGAPADEIAKSAAALGADLIVYGKHQVFHRDLPRAGLVPYRSMLSQRCPVVIVPGKS